MEKAIYFIILILSCASYILAQEEQMGGSSTGEAKNYTSRRTTGIIDAKAAKIFEDMTAQTALKNFRCVSGGAEKNYIIETTACTVAVFDYDNDGKPDVFLLNGSTINAERGTEKPAKAALFRNLGEWKFEDVTEKAGLANERWGMGVTVADSAQQKYLTTSYSTPYGSTKNNWNVKIRITHDC
jgi:hypothetical protein